MGSTGEKLRDRLLARQPAVIVVDMQNDFCHSDGALGRRGLDLGAVQAVGSSLVGFLDVVRASTPIIFIKTHHDDWTDARAWTGRQEGDALGICRTGGWGAEFYAVTPASQDRVVIKHRYDGFFGTDLDLILRARQVDTVVMTGVTTNVCVESTARQAFFHGYRLVLAADLTAALSPAEHAASLYSLETYFDAVTADAHAIAQVLSGRNRLGGN